jgi:hypothetical protein
MSESIIANVKPDGSGGGNLKLQAAELIARDLYDYDEGKLLSASINFTGSKDGVLGNEYAGEYGMHDKAKTDHATIGQGEVKVNGEQLSAEQLQTRGVNSNVANAEETTRDEEVKPTKFVWTEYDKQKAEEIINSNAFEERLSEGLKLLITATEKLSNFFKAEASVNPNDFIAKVTELKGKLPPDEKYIADEILKQYQLGIENGLSPEAARYIVERLNESELEYARVQQTPETEWKLKVKGVDKKLYSGPYGKWSEAYTVATEYYGGYENIPQSVKDNIDAKQLPYTENSELKFVPEASVKSSHERLSHYGYKAGQILNIKEEVLQKYGTSATIALTAINVMTGGGVGKAIASIAKTAVGEQVFGEYLEKGKDYLVEQGAESLKEYDPYLSKKSAANISKLGLELGAIAAGLTIDKLRVGKTNNIQNIDNSKKLDDLPGPQLPKFHSSNFKEGKYNNRLLNNNEKFYKYHGIDNRTGRKYSYVTNKKFMTEHELRSDLAIEDSWGVKITSVSEFMVPAGTWISEGIAGPQVTYKGGGYQAIITNIPKQWIVTTKKAFSNE